jgi:hypothetical protein
MNTYIIGVSGRKQSGKSTLCDFIAKEYNDSDIKIYSFADPLKRFCIDAMGLKEEQCYGTDDDKNTFTEYNWESLPATIRKRFGMKADSPGVWIHDDLVGGGRTWYPDEFEIILRTGPITGREILQIFGTDIMRGMFSDQIWVNATISLIKKENPPIALIADARFESEINALMAEENGHVIRLTRKICEDSHPSETELDSFDFAKLGERCLVIDNQDMEEAEKNVIAQPFFEKIKNNVDNIIKIMIESE